MISKARNGRSLKLGVLDLVPVYGQRDDAYALEQAVRLAQKAEQLGYTRYWVAEHHDMPHLACPTPEVLLAHIGARTERIRLGSGALLLPHYSPLKVAETFRMLASLYPGRIDLGIGRAPGGNAHASMALSGNFLENVKHMPDKLLDLAKLLQDSYTYEGEPVGARPNPPVQPEVWLLGTNKKSAQYAAAFGMGYGFGQFMSDTDPMEVLGSYRDSFVPSTFSAEPRMMITIGVVCADTDEEAEDLALSARFRQEPQNDGTNPGRRLLVGAPGSIASRMRQLSERYAVEEFMLVTMVEDYEQRLRCYELLAPLISS